MVTVKQITFDDPKMLGQIINKFISLSNQSVNDTVISVGTKAMKFMRRQVKISRSLKGALMSSMNKTIGGTGDASYSIILNHPLWSILNYGVKPHMVYLGMKSLGRDNTIGQWAKRVGFKGKSFKVGVAAGSPTTKPGLRFKENTIANIGVITPRDLIKNLKRRLRQL